MLQETSITTGQNLPVATSRRAELLRVLDGIDRAIGVVVDGVAAVLLLVEIVLLAGTVFARYVMKTPVTWVDELATIAFLWLGMLGVASALRRGLHMRLTFLVSQLRPHTRFGIETVADVVLLTFLSTLLLPSLELAQLNHALSSPDLGIPGSVSATATVASLLLMVVLLLIRLARALSFRGFALACLSTAAAVAAISFVGPILASLGNLNLVLFFGLGVGVLILIGVPIAFSFGTATVAFFLLTSDMPLSVIAGRVNEGMSHFILLTIPLFIFLGYQIQYTGMAQSMVNFFVALIGRLRGGLGYVLLCAMYLVSGISGAKAADMAAIGPILAPAMKQRGTREGDIPALLAVSAAAAETIPPSLVLIIIGSVTGVSIAALFTGGLLPAVVSMLALAGVVYLRSRDELRGEGRPDVRLIGRTFVVALPGLALPLIIRAAVLEGVATATEVATIGIVYVLIFGILLMRTISFRRMAGMLVETAAMSGAVLIIIALAGAMSWALTQSGFATELVRFMTHLPGGKPSFLAVSILAFVVLGSVLEGIPAIVLFGPLLFPAAQALGINQVQYAIVVLLSMGLGLFSPPFGYGYYTACAIAQVSPDQAMRNMVPYLVAFAIAISIVAAVPWLSTGFL
jgi:tripartite ATP-independent transporter DctM subunit